MIVTLTELKAHLRILTNARCGAGAHGGSDTDHGRSQRFPYEGSGSDDGDGSEKLTLHDYIYSTYNTLLDSGWRFDDIDRMDMIGFLKVRAWKAQRNKEKSTPKRAFIDEVWPKME